MRPTPFTAWEHQKGGVYTVLAIDRQDDVLYVAHDGGALWERPLSEFMDGRFKPATQMPLLAGMIGERG